MILTPILNKYRQKIKQQFPKHGAKVRCVKKFGWVTYPSGVTMYCARLEIYWGNRKSFRVSLYVERSGAWHTV